MKLSKPIVTGFGENQKTISEINIKQEDFTAKVLLESERAVSYTHLTLPTTSRV